MAQTTKQLYNKQQQKDKLRELTIRVAVIDDLLLCVSDERATLEMIRKRNALLCKIEALRLSLTSDVQ